MKRLYVKKTTPGIAEPKPGEPIEEEEEYEYIEYRSDYDLFKSAVNIYEDDLHDTAYILLDQILKLYPESELVEDVLFFQAKLLFIKHLYEQAILKHEELFTLFPDTRFKEESTYYLYLCYRELELEDEAEEKKDEFAEAYPESEYVQDITLEFADNFYKERDYIKAIEYYLNYYKISSDEDERADVHERVVDIVDNILITDELESIADSYYDKFPAAYIKLSLAKSYYLHRSIDDAKFLLFEVEEFFPTFDRLDEVHAYLEKIKLRVETSPNVIACLLPLSGKYGAYGQRLLAGVMLAADIFSEEEIEYPITIMVKDTKGDPKTALKMLEEAYIKDNAIAVIGPLLSKNAQVCAERAEQLRMPIMLLTQKEKITEGYQYVYRKFITNSQQISSLVDYAMNDKGILRYAVMYPENTYGRELQETFFNEVINRGGKIIASESYDIKESDFSKEIKKMVGLHDLSDRKRLRKLWVDEVIEEETIDMQYMISKGKMTKEEVENYLDELKRELLKEEYCPVVDFQAIFVPDNYKRAGLIIPQLLYHDIDKGVLKLGTNAYNSKELIDIARDNANGIVFVDGFFKDSKEEDVKNFVLEYKEIFQKTPTLLEAESYDSAKIIIGLIKGYDLQDREEMKAALDGLKDYDGVTGLVKSFVNGDADEDLVLLTIERERIKQLLREKTDESLLREVSENSMKSGSSGND
jgi:ABC-type branched-subunit amino acid transport system substrate-binding protein/TolA-binding protein